MIIIIIVIVTNNNGYNHNRDDAGGIDGDRPLSSAADTTRRNEMGTIDEEDDGVGTRDDKVGRRSGQIGVVVVLYVGRRPL